MNILYFNRSDSEGGAARGAACLLQGVRARGVEAVLRVQRKKGVDDYVAGPPVVAGKVIGFSRRILESAFSGGSRGRENGLFSPALLPDRSPRYVAASGAEIIHLHWVARMMRLESLLHFGVPVIWTLHDSWPFTGGCFLPGDCTRYRESCGKCPVLGSCAEEDLSRRVLRRKRDAWRDVDLTLIAPSRWMGERAKASSLFRGRRVEIIPNGVDEQRFRPFDRESARAGLSLAQGKKLILFGAKEATTDRNKGFHLLVAALHEIAAGEWRDKVELVVFGAGDQGPPPGLDLKSRFLGWQGSDDSLARLYSAADLFVLPSLQENLPYAVMEAMACGTPCVAFDQGGLPDLIEHQRNGYLARPYDSSDLARGITGVLSNEERRRRMGADCRRKVERDFAIGRVAQRHMALYQDIFKRRSPASGAYRP